MSLSVNSTASAGTTYRWLSAAATQQTQTLAKLATGSRITRAADDAAGLALSEGLRSQITGLKQAVRNTQDGISVARTAEGALSSTSGILQRMRELSVQAANTGSLSPTASGSIQTEMTQLTAQLDQIAGTTSFNGTKLLDGSYTGKQFQVGADVGETITLDVPTAAGAGALGVAGLDVATDPGAALTAIDSAIARVSTQRADIGAVQNRLGSAVSSLTSSVVDQSASESRIRDADMALEMINLSRVSILGQVGVSLLAQANQTPRAVLGLLS